MTTSIFKSVIIGYLNSNRDSHIELWVSRLVKDINSDYNKWTAITNWSIERNVECVSKIYSAMVQVVQNKDERMTEFYIDDQDDGAWEIHSLDENNDKFNTFSTFVTNVIYRLLHCIHLKHQKNAESIINTELLNTIPDNLKELHDIYSLAFDTLFKSLVNDKGYKVRVLLSAEGEVKLNSKSDYISLTAESQRGCVLDTYSGNLDLDISINGVSGWITLTKSDYVDIVVIVKDPVSGDIHGCISLLDVIVNPSEDILHNTLSPTNLNNVVSFRQH